MAAMRRPSRGKMLELVAPAVAEFGPAMDAQDRQIGAVVRPGDDDIERDVAIGDGDGAHGFPRQDFSTTMAEAGATGKPPLRLDL